MPATIAVAYRDAGWTAASALPENLLAPVRAAATAALEKTPWPELLCGVHNPFGRHACVPDAWAFLDVAESGAVLDPLEAVLGPDLVFWDSEILPDGALLSADEARCWPVEPLAGTLVVIALGDGAMRLVDIARLAALRATLPAGPLYVLRYMPATSRYLRDDRAAPNLHGAEVRVLVNHAKQPIWLVRGEDRAGNDFATGFSLPAAQWAGITSPHAQGTGREIPEES
ncbi:MAG: resolvase [Rhodoplanes sp.]|uniref:resolvase n=1 Tax=Rhodoplanes sp. TaxID=1968906 RepID=UPI001848EB53|nr:resolvase [Rhodoplanes sp.]NVO16696.1 resolvase [Rhodoplanes sp.]